MKGYAMASAKRLALIPLLLVPACREPEAPTVPRDLRFHADAVGDAGAVIDAIPAAVTVRGRTSLEDHALVDGGDALPPGRVMVSTSEPTFSTAFESARNSVCSGLRER